MVVSILRNTPVWVWLVLALTIWLGGSALKPQMVRLWRLSLLPSAATIWSVWKIATAATMVPVLAAWATSLLLGAGIGFSWGRSRPLQLIDRGRVLLPGTSVWLVFGLVSFGLYYALNVFLALNRDLQSAPEWIIAPYALGGLGIGLAWGWLWGLIIAADRSRTY